MTALDQAFIKAYRAESGAPAASPPAKPSLDLQPEPQHPEGRILSVSPPETQPPAPHMDLFASFGTQVSVVGIFDPVAAPAVGPPPEIEKPTSPTRPAHRLPPLVRPLRPPVAQDAGLPAATAAPPPAAQPPAAQPPAAQPPATVSADLAPPRLPETESPLQPETPAPAIEKNWTLGKGFHRIDPAETPRPLAMAPRSARTAAKPDMPSEAPTATVQTKSPKPFRPLLQVDRFAWPKVCQRLDQKAAAELDGLAEQLAAARDRGIRVVGMAGCSPGDGTSTVLLCAARQLAQRGLRVAIVDANLADPQLARRLGLLPELGLEHLLDGRQPLEEVAIESVADTVVLAPLSSAYTEQLDGESAKRLSGAIDALAGAYDLVLVDLGSLEEPVVANGSVVGASCVRPAAVVLVQNDQTSAKDLAIAARRMLGRSRAELLGLIENFRRDCPA